MSAQVVCKYASGMFEIMVCDVHCNNQFLNSVKMECESKKNMLHVNRLTACFFFLDAIVFTRL